MLNVALMSQQILGPASMTTAIPILSPGTKSMVLVLNPAELQDDPSIPVSGIPARFGKLVVQQLGGGDVDHLIG
jgi:hypothetical protein